MSFTFDSVSQDVVVLLGMHTVTVLLMFIST